MKSAGPALWFAVMILALPALLYGAFTWSMEPLEKAAFKSPAEYAAAQREANRRNRITFGGYAAFGVVMFFVIILGVR